jgi:thiamine pyrophosphokinase
VAEGRVVVVVVGGDGAVAGAVGDLPENAYVIAADSGFHHAVELGLRVDLLVGDMDSVSLGGLAAALAAGAGLEEHPSEKDETDLELALNRALVRQPSRIVVVGGAGGRFDHVMANVLVLTADRLAGIAVEGRFGTARITIVRDEALVEGSPGDLLTLLAITGPALGVTTSGLKYALHDEDLAPSASRGVSNELIAPIARIMVRSGILLAIQPTAFPE